MSLELQACDIAEVVRFDIAACCTMVFDDQWVDVSRQKRETACVLKHVWGSIEAEEGREVGR